MVAGLSFPGLAQGRDRVMELGTKPRASDAPALHAFSKLDGGLLSVVPSVLRLASEQQGKVRLSGLALEGGQEVELEVERLRVVGPNTKVVVGGPGGVDVPLPFNADDYVTLHGTVRGVRDSSVVLVSNPRGVRGYFDLGSGRGKHTLISVASDGQVAGAQVAQLQVMKKTGSDALPGAPLCGNHALHAREGSVAGCCFEPSPDFSFHTRLSVTEIALESDYDLYANFNDLTVTTDYLIELIARTNALFIRDIRSRFELVYMRLFDNPANEPSFMGNEDPLNGYVNFWNSNMGSVQRDTAAFMSGRRDLPYGGIAYVGAVCTNFAYCVNGYLNGFPDATKPNSGDYDLGVTAHELGHNFGACHTPDYCPPVDQCFPPPVTPQRGTMMSYCSQTVSGGNMVTELWYHTRLRRVMRDFVEFSGSCLHYDCDDNGVDDAIDVQNPALDTNSNGIPDACEDCNNNSVLDPLDIASPTSADVNSNGIPDECEPDCNGNGIPDDWDIIIGNSFDTWGNGIPDECDPDCNQNNIPDYNEIQANLTLDIDRNVVLDECQDCDNNGINDLVDLQGARNAWVASDVLNYIGEYHAISGVRVKTSTPGQLNAAQDLIIAPGNRVLVSSGNAHKIVAYNAISGAHLGDFVPAGSGGLSFPTGLTMGPNGNLFVCSRNNASVLQYDGGTGSFIGAFVASGAGGLTSPFGIAFGPNGNLFVTSGGNRVLEFDGSTGAFVREFVPQAGNGGMTNARGILFLPDGHLLVASYQTDALLRFDGTTGSFLGKWNSGGTTSALYLDGPWGLRLGPNGNVFATRDLPAAIFEDDHDHDGEDHDHELDDALEFTAPLHVTSARIMEFDITNGQYLQSYIVGDDTLLRSPTGFDFMPGTADCNFNLIPDNCDRAACKGEPACSDCNGNGVMDGCDIAACAGAAACSDCNANGVPDGCDLIAGTSVDVDPANGRPDECDVSPPPPPAADPSGVNKSRFISFSVPAATVAGGSETALRVRLASLHHVNPPYTAGPSIPFSSLEGEIRWVGPPTLYQESSTSQETFWAASLQCDPYYHDWSTVGLLHVTGSAVVPSSNYQVENLAASCAGIESSCQAVSTAVSVSTARWGDVEVPYNPPSVVVQPDLADVSALVNKFRGAPGAPIKARALLVGGDAIGTVAISGDLSFVHISACVDAFRGTPYPHTIATCP